MSAAKALPSVNSRKLSQETEKVSDFNSCPAPNTNRIVLEYPFLRKVEEQKCYSLEGVDKGQSSEQTTYNKYRITPTLIDTELLILSS